MAVIVANVRKLGLGDSQAAPIPIYLEIQWVLGSPVSFRPQSGIFQGTVDPTLNKNQMETAIRAALAAYLTALIGVNYVANDVEGITL